MSAVDANIDIKSTAGISERNTIKDVIIQATVWAGMLFTSTLK